MSCALPCGSYGLAVGVALGLLGCSTDTQQVTTLPLPTGHYEGPISYRGSDVRVALDLREAAPGQLEADLHFLDGPGLSFAATNLRYKEPQLMFDQPGTVPHAAAINAIREGDFLRGVFTLDSIKTEFVWVRRGQAAPRAYQTEAFAPTAGATSRLTLLVPADTVARHPAVALLADAATANAAAARADLLARQGVVAVVVPVENQAAADSNSLRRVAAMVQALRRQPTVDSLRVGLWLRGTSAAQLVGAATIAEPAASFVLLENVPLTSAADAQPWQQLSRQRVPVLALYAEADTSLNARDSARRLRAALGGRGGSAVRTFAQATADFMLPGRLQADEKWRWPQPAPGFSTAATEWVQQRGSR